VFSCSSNAEAISEGITLFANVPVASGPSHRAKLQRSHLVSAIVVDETFPLNNCQQNITVATVLSVLYCTTENIIISVQYFSLPVLVSVLSSRVYRAPSSAPLARAVGPHVKEAYPDAGLHRRGRAGSTSFCPPEMAWLHTFCMGGRAGSTFLIPYSRTGGNSGPESDFVSSSI
jgi:hypothetical protein